MTVEQLIEKLQKYPSKSIVVVNMGRNELANGCQVDLVEEENAYAYCNEDQWHKDYDYASDDDDDYTRTKVVNICSGS